MMPDTFSQNQSQSQSQGNGQGNGLGGETAGRDALAGQTPRNPADVTATDMPDISKPQQDEPPAIDKTYEGKLVFSPNELNQAGEDKEYFPPEKGHKFDAPKDANAHALTPDIEVAPDNTVKKID